MLNRRPALLGNKKSFGNMDNTYLLLGWRFVLLVKKLRNAWWWISRYDFATEARNFR